jgi:hypothetical protein
MTDTTNVISLRTGMPRAEPLESSEYSLTVGDENYRVRRAVDRDTQRGFVTIVDEAGKALLVFSSSFPDEHVSQLIVGWRAGHKQGLDRGRLDGIEPGIAATASRGR